QIGKETISHIRLFYYEYNLTDIRKFQYVQFNNNNNLKINKIIMSRTSFSPLCFTIFDEFGSNKLPMVKYPSLFYSLINYNNCEFYSIIHPLRTVPHFNRHLKVSFHATTNAYLLFVKTEHLQPKPYDTNCYEYQYNGINEPKSHDHCVVKCAH